MITVTKQLRTETGHRLMNYDGRCSHLHGHSYLWEVTATAPGLSPNGMVMDFKELKKAMHAILDPLDHSMVLAYDDPAIDIIAEMEATNGAVQRVIVFDKNPTAENLAKWAAEEICRYLFEESNKPLTCIDKVRVWETATSYAEWRRHD